MPKMWPTFILPYASSGRFLPARVATTAACAAPLSALMCAILAGGLVASSCRPEDDDDDVPPRLLSISPRETVVPVATAFRLVFSEPLNPITVSADTASDLLSVILVPKTSANGSSEVFNEALLSDLDNPPLSQSRLDDVVPVDVTLESQDTVLRIAPRAPLSPNRAYVLVINALRDTSGNPLVDATGVKAPFIWQFSTGAGQPAVESTSIDAGTVVSNLRRIRVTFTQPVTGVDATTLRVTGNGAALAPDIEAILMEETGRTATVVVASGAEPCARFTPGGAYTLEASDGIRGLDGQALLPDARIFSVSSICDDVPLTISDLAAVPGDVSALIRFSTNKPGTTEVRYGLVGGAQDCLGAPCPLEGAATNTLEQPHVVTIAGLMVDTDYAFTVRSEDEVGSVALASGTLRTARLPKVALNEAMANPTTAQDAQGEFVELLSFEDEDTLSLEGWTLRVTKLPISSSDTPNLAVLPAGTTLAPGAFIVLADTAFIVESYPGLSAGAVVAFGDFDGLQNQAILIELLDTGGRVISSITSPSPREGRSLERVRSDAPDEPASFCFSREDTGPTPGRENGVAARGCE